MKDFREFINDDTTPDDEYQGVDRSDRRFSVKIETMSVEAMPGPGGTFFIVAVGTYFGHHSAVYSIS